MAAPLEGLRIIEMAGLGPAPFAAMMLADHGAEVIRIHPVNRKAEFALLNTRFDVLARGRRSIALDLAKDGASAMLLDLVASADGLVEGFRPGVMERLGVGPQTCHERNPNLVYGRMTGWGQEGPYADYVGHDLNYVGLTGALNAIGPADRPPTVPLNYVADFGGGGMLLAFGMVSAMLAVRAGGTGQVVDAAMVDGASLLAAMFWGFRAGGGWSDQREANLLDGGAYFYTTYACADGKFVAVACVEPRFHDVFLERLKLDSAEFTHHREPARWPELRAKLQSLLLTRPRDYWVALFEGSEGCVTPVLDWSEAPNHPHATARDAFIEIDGVVQPAPAPRFSHAPASKPTGPAAVGANTIDVLRDWGISEERIKCALDVEMIRQE